MIEKIYSEIDGTVLHLVNRMISEERRDLCPPGEYLQVACFSMPKGKTFKPHVHLPLQRWLDITQETWIVLSGEVLATFYDIDGTELCKRPLSPGDCSITFRGGHTYESMANDTRIYEVKTGPYYGQEKDKIFVEDMVKAEA